MNDSEPDNPGVIVLPPLIPLAGVLVGLLLDWIWPLRLLAGFGLVPRLVVGAIFVVAGVALVIVAGHFFAKAETNIRPWKPALHLVTSGIYAHMRNPMYVGFFLITMGLAIAFASDRTFVCLVPAAIVLHRGVVLREERYLEARFGEDYRRYQRDVPRYGWGS